MNREVLKPACLGSVSRWEKHNGVQSILAPSRPLSAPAVARDRFLRDEKSASLRVRSNKLTATGLIDWEAAASGLEMFTRPSKNLPVLMEEKFQEVLAELRSAPLGCRVGMSSQPNHDTA